MLVLVWFYRTYSGASRTLLFRCSELLRLAALSCTNSCRCIGVGVGLAGDRMELRAVAAY